MNYQRIYDQFIADRRTKSPDGTFEVHHILPRSLGGDDDQLNLIPLSPEDHFFAHLLLAKIHGGKMWFPIIMWVGGDRKNWSGRRSRLEYGWASRMANAARTGVGSPVYDHTIHSFEHSNGTLVDGQRAEIAELTGLSGPAISMILRGRVQSMNGWFLAGKRPDKIGRGARPGTSNPMAITTKYEFRHVDGRKFYGAPVELANKHGTLKSSLYKLVRGQITVADGWYIAGTKISSGGRAQRYLDAANDNVLKVA